MKHLTIGASAAAVGAVLVSVVLLHHGPGWKPNSAVVPTSNTWNTSVFNDLPAFASLSDKGATAGGEEAVRDVLTTIVGPSRHGKVLGIHLPHHHEKLQEGEVLLRTDCYGAEYSRPILLPASFASLDLSKAFPYKMKLGEGGDVVPLEYMMPCPEHLDAFRTSYKALLADKPFLASLHKAMDDRNMTEDYGIVLRHQHEQGNLTEAAGPMEGSMMIRPATHEEMEAATAPHHNATIEVEGAHYGTIRAVGWFWANGTGTSGPFHTYGCLEFYVCVQG
ncbi:unnamed protein product [Vitrella brassicaformis CCMP3155]|uniref:Uncharacterized protein n=1 Tax=Vitrella brassicaformis (strain CCMP3155) TaxID=1169540 RepID=A0A0G4ERM4_VITBC|nr:unnamed protein product [Vitrella brassicaformis CCMP3155]|eukprot:CEM00285.1 unnamed protein product [Vitrella brassicaformis CCMP3155]